MTVHLTPVQVLDNTQPGAKARCTLGAVPLGP